MRFGGIPCVCIALLTFETAGASDEPTQRQDPYPAVWLDASALFVPRFGEVKFIARDRTQLSAFVYRSTAFDPRSGAIWFVMHGAGRSARTYLRAAAPVAERRNALAIAIEFSERAYPAVEGYTLGVTIRGRPDERARGERRWRDRDSYVYSELEHVFEAVRRSFGGRQQGYYVFGHSAGAQFVHRLLTFVPDARVLGAVAANAGWYTLPVSGDGAQARMPYGLRGTPLEGAELRSLFQAPLTVMLGESDIAQAREDRLLRATPAAMWQGATRFARGQNYFATARVEAARISAPFKWRLAIVPRAAHEASQVMGSADFFLFESGEPCMPTPAATADAVVINEVLADPPKGARGDANADGVRDPSDDEFVEIINAGRTPVCMAGWTLGDASDPLRHVFPLGDALLPGQALVVFGGGVPTGRFGGAQVQWAAFAGRLDLSNEGDVLTLRDATGTLVKQMSWGDCAGQPCARDHRAGELGIGSSLVRWPEMVGGWAVHTEKSPFNFSPGVHADGTFYSSVDERMRKHVAVGGESREQ
jgi:hypothetical protein